MGWRRTDHCTDVTPCDRGTNLLFATGEVKGHRLASGGKRVCGRALMNLHGRPVTTCVCLLPAVFPRA